jgi:hypothetical protein
MVAFKGGFKTKICHSYKRQMEFDKFNDTKVRKLLNIFYVFGNFNFNIFLIVTQVSTNNNLAERHVVPAFL